MARPLRIEYPGAWYHVMNRGRRRENIFEEKEDYLLFNQGRNCEECRKISMEFPFRLFNE